MNTSRPTATQPGIEPGSVSVSLALWWLKHTLRALGMALALGIGVKMVLGMWLWGAPSHTCPVQTPEKRLMPGKEKWTVDARKREVGQNEGSWPTDLHQGTEKVKNQRSKMGGHVIVLKQGKTDSTFIWLNTVTSAIMDSPTSYKDGKFEKNKIKSTKGK